MFYTYENYPFPVLWQSYLKRIQNAQIEGITIFFKIVFKFCKELAVLFCPQKPMNILEHKKVWFDFADTVNVSFGKSPAVTVTA